MKLAATLAISTLGFAAADNYAVLVAGSNTFWNYRHQSDVFHAYNILTTNGMSPDNIIMMAYDDIANDSSNPFPGQVFNHPTDAGTPGVDVYPGSDAIDYTGKDVTAENFLKVLKGDSSAPGPVLQTTADDNVFVNFVDHGGAGLIAFPVGDYLYAQDLNDALTYMHDNSMYKELTFYLEACESGSMFEGILGEDMNIYATTAANADEPSWGTYCSPDDSVDGTSIGSCLGDLYSVNWMEDSDKHTSGETLDDQLQIVTKLTDQSHVMQYGDSSMGSEQVSDFMSAASLRLPSSVTDSLARWPRQDSRDATLMYLVNKYQRASEEEHDEILAAIADETASRERADDVFESVVSKVAGEGANLTFDVVTQHQCQKDSVRAAVNACGRFSDYSLKYVKSLVSLCENGHAASTIATALNEVCSA